MLNQQLQNYKIISLLGEGGMANVYLAQHQSLGNNVALKLLKEEYVQHPNIRKRFLAEARSLAQMSHPNIIKVTDLIDAGDIVAFVMEYIEGQTLEEFLFKKGELTQTEIESFFNQMILAVEYVHSQGLIHRDIKPSNFMVTKSSQIKLLDFGIAKNTNEGAVDYTKTGLMQQMGTPLYMSPEQVKNTAEVTKQTDIYSLGVVLWQMVMNKKPYDANKFTLPEIQVAIMKDPLPLTNTGWDSIIQKGTEKDSTNRFLNLELLALNTHDSNLNNSYIKPFDEEKRIGFLKKNRFAILSVFVLFSIAIVTIFAKKENKNTVDFNPEIKNSIPDVKPQNKRTVKSQNREDQTTRIQKDEPNSQKELKATDKKERNYYYKLGEDYNRNGEKNNAITQFSSEIENFPDNLNAYFQRARLLSDIGKKKQAIYDYLYIIEHEDEITSPVFIMGTVYNNTGYDYLELNDYNNAEYYLDKAIKIAPDEYYIWDSRGELFFMQKKYSECITNMTKSIQIYNKGISKASSSSNMGHVYYFRGVSYIQQGYYDKGCDDLNQAEKLGYKKAHDAIRLYCLN